MVLRVLDHRRGTQFYDFAVIKGCPSEMVTLNRAWHWQCVAKMWVAWNRILACLCSGTYSSLWFYPSYLETLGFVCKLQGGGGGWGSRSSTTTNNIVEQFQGWLLNELLIMLAYLEPLVESFTLRRLLFLLWVTLEKSGRQLSLYFWGSQSVTLFWTKSAHFATLFE